jgi:hypothetical protein
MEKLAQTTKRIESSKFGHSIPTGSIVIYDTEQKVIARVTDKGVSNVWMSSRSIPKAVKVIEWAAVK